MARFLEHGRDWQARPLQSLSCLTAVLKAALEAYLQLEFCIAGASKCMRVR